MDTLKLTHTLNPASATPLRKPSYSPSYDNKIHRKFSQKTLEMKVENKLALQRELKWVTETKLPLLCLSSGMSGEQGGALLAGVLPGILSLPCQIAIRGVGSEEFGKLFTKLELESPHRVKILPDDDTARRKIYAASDISLFFAADTEGEELVNCLAYGAVPVSTPQAPLSDYNPVQEAGNAFLADPANAWTWFAALVRAVETLKLPYDFRTIQRHCMESVQGE